MKKAIVRSHNANALSVRDYAAQIVKSMREEKTLFPDPYPSLDEIEKLIDRLTNEIADAMYRDKLAVAIRDDTRDELLGQIRLLSYYVNRIAQGDEVIILGAGFLPSKDRDNSADIPSVESFNVKAEIGSGGVKLSLKAWRRAKTYRYEYRKKNVNQDWTIVLSTRSRCTISELDVREEYEFRVCYVGAKGNSPYSNVLRSYVY
ncbi:MULTISPECIES: hypothetical protein [unclassified Sphingobacterium]|uniref:hypothetical protein n=1 Tax=unclassified Sphingobacterium TaxID=2609468 RepID=UPI0025EAC202|nr:MULTISPECIES: hypothetical protein [unclassified Sphingobacterium]